MSVQLGELVPLCPVVGLGLGLQLTLGFLHMDSLDKLSGELSVEATFLLLFDLDITSTVQSQVKWHCLLLLSWVLCRLLTT